jgi:hypothetical protein
MLWNGNKCGKIEGGENLKAAISNTDYDRSKTARESIIFQLFG